MTAHQRFVLRYRGGDPPAEDVARLEGAPGLSVVQRSGRMVVMEGDGKELAALVGSLDGWLMAPEQTLDVPDTRKRVRRPPDH